MKRSVQKARFSSIIGQRRVKELFDEGNLSLVLYVCTCDIRLSITKGDTITVVKVPVSTARNF